MTPPIDSDRQRRHVVISIASEFQEWNRCRRDEHTTLCSARSCRTIWAGETTWTPKLTVDRYSIVITVFQKFQLTVNQYTSHSHSPAPPDEAVRLGFCSAVQLSGEERGPFCGSRPSGPQGLGCASQEAVAFKASQRTGVIPVPIGIRRKRHLYVHDNTCLRIYTHI